MAELDTSRVSPSDAATTMRSLPRRFRAAVGPVGDEQQADELAERVGPDGSSALDHLAHVVGTLHLLERALDQVQSSDRPRLHPATVDRAARAFDAGPATRSLEPTLDELADAAEAMAARIDRIEADGWARTGDAGGRSVTALDLAREAVATSIARLRAAEQTIAAVRGRPPAD